MRCSSSLLDEKVDPWPLVGLDDGSGGRTTVMAFTFSCVGRRSMGAAFLTMSSTPTARKSSPAPSLMLLGIARSSGGVRLACDADLRWPNLAIILSLTLAPPFLRAFPDALRAIPSVELDAEFPMFCGAQCGLNHTQQLFAPPLQHTNNALAKLMRNWPSQFGCGKNAGFVVAADAATASNRVNTILYCRNLAYCCRWHVDHKWTDTTQLTAAKVLHINPTAVLTWPVTMFSSRLCVSHYLCVNRAQLGLDWATPGKIDSCATWQVRTCVLLWCGGPNAQGRRLVCKIESDMVDLVNFWYAGDVRCGTSI